LTFAFDIQVVEWQGIHLQHIITPQQDLHPTHDTGFMIAFAHDVLKFQAVYLAQPDDTCFLWHGILRFDRVERVFVYPVGRIPGDN
jgi:hypothetical protein